MTPSKTSQRSAPRTPLVRLRAICLALPEAHEVETWGEPTFRVRNKLFAMYAASGNQHTRGRPAVWIKAAPGNQPFMVSHAPKRFFVPPYVGTSGWVGVWLDDVADWEELPELVADAWRLTAPKRLAATLADPAAAPSSAKPARRAAPSVTREGKATSRKSPAKKTAAKKTATKKSATKKSATKKSATKKTVTKSAPSAKRAGKARGR